MIVSPKISATLFGAERDDAERLRDLPGVGSLKVASHSASASEPSYERMVDRFFRVEISIVGKADEEINQAVAEALTQQGFDGGVSLSRGDNGELHLMTDGIEAQGEGITQVQIMLSDADSETAGDLVNEMHGSLP